MFPEPRTECDHGSLRLLFLLSQHVAGVSLNPIIVYCGNQEEMDLWFGLLTENIEANGGTAIAPRNYTRVKVGGSTSSFIGNATPFFSMVDGES